MGYALVTAFNIGKGSGRIPFSNALRQNRARINGHAACDAGLNIGQHAAHD